MSSSESIPPHPSSPPVARGAPPIVANMLPAAPPVAARWPFAIGVVLIIYAALHILGGVCSISSPLWNSVMKSGPAAPGADQIVAVAERWEGWSVGLGIVGAALAAFLLAVGIGFLNRRRWSIGYARIWCFAQIVMAIANSIFGFVFQSDLMKTIAASAPKGGPAGAPPFVAFARVGATFGAVAGLVWGVGLPVFLLIWLARRPVRAEYATWNSAGNSGAANALPRV